MKNELTIIIIALLSMSTVMAFSGSGSGTAEDPYLITDVDELNETRLDLTAHYKLTTDLDLNVSPYNTGSGWEPIGKAGAIWQGTFDGDGNVISNLYINRPSENLVSFFGASRYSNTTRLGFEDADITGHYSTAIITSISEIVSVPTSGPITYSYATGTVTAPTTLTTVDDKTADWNALLCSLCRVEDSWSNGNVWGYRYASGISSNNVPLYRTWTNGSRFGSFVGATGFNNLVFPSLSDNFYLEGTSSDGQEAGVSITSSESLNESTYTNWDFDEVWYMNETLGHPHLQVFRRITGCTDPEAENYNPQANIPDQSCEYDNGGNTRYIQNENGETIGYITGGTIVYFENTAEEPKTTPSLNIGGQTSTFDLKSWLEKIWTQLKEAIE